MDQENTTAITKMSIAGVGTTASLLTLNEWVTLATLVYVVLQIGLLIPKYYAWIKEWYASKN